MFVKVTDNPAYSKVYRVTLSVVSLSAGNYRHKC